MLLVFSLRSLLCGAKIKLWSHVYEDECVQRRQDDQANFRHIKDMIEII